MSTAKLIYEDNYLIINNFRYHQKDIYYNTSFDLEIRSSSFCGVAPCEYDIKEFRKFVEELLEMYDSPSLGFSRQEHWSGLPFPSPMHESEK